MLAVAVATGLGFAIDDGAVAGLAAGVWVGLVTVIQGDPDERLSQVCAIYGAVFLVLCAIVARRG